MKFPRAKKNSVQISDFSYQIHRLLMSRHVISQADLIEAMTVAHMGRAALGFESENGARFWGFQFAQRPGVKPAIRIFEAETLQELPAALGLFQKEQRAA